MDQSFSEYEESTETATLERANRQWRHEGVVSKWLKSKVTGGKPDLPPKSIKKMEDKFSQYITTRNVEKLKQITKDIDPSSMQMNERIKEERGNLDIAQKAKDYGKIAGIHNGTTDYAKEMIELGYKLVTILSDFRVMSSNSQKIVDEMKNQSSDKSASSSY